MIKLILSVALAVFGLAKPVLDFIMSPIRRRKSVLKKLDAEKKEALHLVGDLTSEDKADRDKARKELLKEIRE